MAAFCHFYRMPPREFWQLTQQEFDYMASFAIEQMKPTGL